MGEPIFLKMKLDDTIMMVHFRSRLSGDAPTRGPTYGPSSPIHSKYTTHAPNRKASDQNREIESRYRGQHQETDPRHAHDCVCVCTNASYAKPSTARTKHKHSHARTDVLKALRGAYLNEVVALVQQCLLVHFAREVDFVPTERIADLLCNVDQA